MALALLVEVDLVLAEATCFGARPRRYCGQEFWRILAHFLANWVAWNCVVDRSLPADWPEASSFVRGGVFGGVRFSAGGGGLFRGSRIWCWRRWPFSGELDLSLAVEMCIGAVGGDAAGRCCRMRIQCRRRRQIWGGLLLVAGCFFAEADSAQTETAWFDLSVCSLLLAIFGFWWIYCWGSRLKPQGAAAAARGVPSHPLVPCLVYSRGFC